MKSLNVFGGIETRNSLGRSVVLALALTMAGATHRVLAAEAPSSVPFKTPVVPERFDDNDDHHPTPLYKYAAQVEWHDGSRGIITGNPWWNSDFNQWVYPVLLHESGITWGLAEEGLHLADDPKAPIKE